MSQIKITDTKLKEEINLLNKKLDSIGLTKEEREVILKYSSCNNGNFFLYLSIQSIKDKYPNLYTDFMDKFKVKTPIDDISNKDLVILDKIIKKMKIPRPLTVYRGTSIERFNDLTICNGNIIRNIYYMSTTLNDNFIKYFIDYKRPLLLEINLPKNYPALWLHPYSFYPLECELLLGRNHEFKIVDDKDVNISDKKVKKLTLDPIKPNLHK